MSINQVQPIYVQFAVSEKQLPDIRKYAANATLEAFASFPGVDLPQAKGKLQVIDNKVDPSTGMINLRAVFPNEDLRLWPGQFVETTLVLAQEKAVLVDSRAVMPTQQGDAVFVIEPNATVSLRYIATSREEGPDLVVAKGLMPGEKVALDGQIKLFPGARVQLRQGNATGSDASSVGGAD